MTKSVIEGILNVIDSNKKDGSKWQYVYGFRRKSGHVTKISTAPVTTSDMSHFPTVTLSNDYLIVKSLLDTDIGMPQPIVEFIDYDDITEVLVFNKDGVVSTLYNTSIHYVANVRNHANDKYRFETKTVSTGGSDAKSHNDVIKTYSEVGFDMPVPDGYEFLYWSTSPSKNDPEADIYKAGETLNGLYEDLYLYAIWGKSTSSSNNSGSSSGSGSSSALPQPDSQTGVYTVPFDQLDDLLDSLPENNTDDPYQINVTDLNEDNITENTNEGE